MKVHMKLSDKEETYMDSEIFTMNFDAQTGEMDVNIAVPDEESGSEVGVALKSTFENVTKGKGFTWTLNQVTVSADGMEMPILSGYVMINSEYEKIETPAEVDMLADMDTTDVMGIMMELQTNAESWMEKWGLAEEETDEDDITTLPETDEEMPVVTDTETETE